MGVGLGWVTSIYAGFSFLFFVVWVSLMAHVLRNEFRMNPDLNQHHYQPTYVSRSFFPLYSYSAGLAQLQDESSTAVLMLVGYARVSR